MITTKNIFCFCGRGRGLCLSASQSSHLRSLPSHLIFTFCELHIFKLSIFTSYVFTPVSLLIPHFFTFIIFNFLVTIQCLLFAFSVFKKHSPPFVARHHSNPFPIHTSFCELRMSLFEVHKLSLMEFLCMRIDDECSGSMMHHLRDVDQIPYTLLFMPFQA